VAVAFPIVGVIKRGDVWNTTLPVPVLTFEIKFLEASVAITCEALSPVITADPIVKDVPTILVEKSEPVVKLPLILEFPEISNVNIGAVVFRALFKYTFARLGLRTFSVSQVVRSRTPPTTSENIPNFRWRIKRDLIFNFLYFLMASKKVSKKTQAIPSVKAMTGHLKAMIHQMQQEEDEEELETKPVVKKVVFKWKEEYFGPLLEARCVQYASQFIGSKSTSQRGVAWERIAFGLNSRFKINLSKEQVRKKYSDLRLEYTKFAALKDQTGNQVDALDDEGNPMPLDNEQEPIAYPDHWDMLVNYFGQKVGLGHVDFGQSLDLNASSEMGIQYLLIVDFPEDSDCLEDAPKSTDAIVQSQRKSRASRSNGKAVDIAHGLMSLGESMKEGMLAHSAQHQAPPTPAIKQVDVDKLNNMLDTIATVNAKLLNLLENQQKQ
jgi:hypothetical protein